MSPATDGDRGEAQADAPIPKMGSKLAPPPSLLIDNLAHADLEIRSNIIYACTQRNRSDYGWSSRLSNNDASQQIHAVQSTCPALPPSRQAGRPHFATEEFHYGDEVGTRAPCGTETAQEHLGHLSRLRYADSQAQISRRDSKENQESKTVGGVVGKKVLPSIPFALYPRVSSKLARSISF